ncbi:MAG: DUF2505 domain-containing protein [Pseudomonadales bacterium]|nr:DUF2505 domain-containing protein [Pseudomonadales bacterium]
MELEVTHAYDSGLERVLAAFFAEDHIHSRNEKVGARNVEIQERALSEQTGKLVISREVQSATQLPGILASFHRDWHRVRQEEHWFCKDEGEWHCEFRVHIDGVPAKIKGTMRLQELESGCQNQLTLNVRCELPLIGKTVAKFLLDDSRRKIEREHLITRELLAWG